MESQKRGGLYAKLFKAVDARKRLKADRLSGDRLTVLPSSILLHLLLPCFTFEEQMTDIRQVNKTLHSLVERCVTAWMNERFGKALAIIEREERKKFREESSRQWMRDWAASAASSSASIAAATTPPAASFTMQDAAWVVQQLQRWVPRLFNRGINLRRDEMEQLRVPSLEVASAYLLPPAKIAPLGCAEKTVNGRSLASSYWLFDLLHLVFQHFGHISNFLPLYEARKAKKSQQRSRLLEVRERNKDPERLKAAMEAQGVDWSQWTWDQAKEKWATPGMTVYWRGRGAGRWKLATYWHHNMVHHHQSYTLALKAHAALKALGCRCDDCGKYEGMHGCYVNMLNGLDGVVFFDSDEDDEDEADEGGAAAADHHEAGEDAKDVILLDDDEEEAKGGRKEETEEEEKAIKKKSSD